MIFMYILLTKKNIFLIIISLLFVIAITFSCKHYIAGTKNTNWGLSFQAKGEPPIGNASTEYLKNFNSYFLGNITKKEIYLTFDAGYEAGYMPQILEALKKHNVKATFFIVGTLIESNPETIKAISDAGHYIGNHTMHHPNMSKISTMDSFKKEIEDVENLYKELTGKNLDKFYRPPQGVYSEKNLKMANELGYKTIFWSLAYVDWYKNNQPTHEEAFNKLLPRLHNGAIILLHSTSKTNSEILDELITKIKNLGYTFGDLKNLEKAE